MSLTPNSKIESKDIKFQSIGQDSVITHDQLDTNYYYFDSPQSQSQGTKIYPPSLRSYAITMATNNSNYGTTSIDTATYTVSDSDQTRALSHSVKNSNIYQFNSWSTDKGSISGSTLTIPAYAYGDFSVTGNFGLKTFTITVQSGGSGGSVSGSTIYSYRTSAQTRSISYSANSGYKFNYWSVSGPSSGSAYASGSTLTIGAGAYGNITVTGYFALIVPTSLSIGGSWSNTQYTGQAVDYTGLSFTCTYSDGSTATVTPSSYSPTTWSSTVGTQTCTFYYTENGVTVSANKNANVAKPHNWSSWKYIGGTIFYIDSTSTTYEFRNASGTAVSAPTVGTNCADWTYRYDLDEYTKDKFYVYRDLVTSKCWGYYNITTSATGNSIGAGKTNTSKVLAKTDTSSYASGSIWEYIRSMRTTKVNGCDDWFVGCKDEYNELKSSGIVSWFSSHNIWSSYEQDRELAVCSSYRFKLWLTAEKTSTRLDLIPIRAF